MDYSFIYMFSAVLVVVCFFAITWWAFSSGARKGFEEAANIPFDEDELPASGRYAPTYKKDNAS